MRDLLPYYEQELTFLRRHAREFAERYPKIASRLQITGDSCDDPHIERVIESFAILSARTKKKLDDDFPEFTASFLNVLYPHYLRPIPACSIARFNMAGAEAQLSGVTRIPRGTSLNTRPVKGINCKFRSVYDVDLSPIQVSNIAYTENFTPPKGTLLPVGSTALLSLTLVSASEQLSLDVIDLDKLQLYIDGESSQVAQIREAMLSRAMTVMLERPDTFRWTQLPQGFTQPAGFGLDEELLDYDARSHLAYRLLSEFFIFPEKFNFINLDFARLRKSLIPGTRQCTLHFVLGNQSNAGRDARLLERVNLSNVLTHCTPVVNLFAQSAEPIRLTHTKSDYPVVADARRAYAFELYSIESVHKVEKTVTGEQIFEYRPYFALRHGEQLDDSSRFWHLSRNDQVAELSPGFEYELSVIDIDFNTYAEKTETLSIELTCTNRDLPAQLPIGAADGDLFMEGGSLARSISLLRKPTDTTRIDRQKSHWQLISHLSLSHLSLAENNVETLKETLSVYDVNRSPVTRKIIDGLVSIEHKVVTARLAGNPFPSFVKGIEIRLTVNEQNFVGTSVEQVGRLLDHFFGLYVHINSFTQLIILSSETGEELMRCQPRNGDQLLV